MTDLIAKLPLIAFLAFIIDYLINAFFIVFHLLKFGLDYKTKILFVFFLSGLALLFPLVFYFFFRIDWTQLMAKLSI
jgi:hypothetical protein